MSSLAEQATGDPELVFDVLTKPQLEIYPVRLLLFDPSLSVVRRFPTS